MKVMITGVAGFLGSHITDRLLEKGYDIVGVDNFSGGRVANVNPHIEFHAADCNDLEKMKRLSEGVEIVFHAACTPHDNFSICSPYIITKNTFQSTMSMLSASVSNSVRKFVYCSSMARYGKQETPLFTEDMICNPQTPYGWAKYTSEKIIEQLAELYGMQYVIVVPHNIIGPRQNYRDPYRNVVAIIINRLLQNKAPIIYGDGTQKRCFSYIDDVINCLEKIITDDNINKEIINVGPDEEFVSINELVKYLIEIADIDIEPIYVEARPLEVPLANCSADKARKLLGYKTQTRLFDALNKCFEYIKQAGVGSFYYNALEIEINNDITPKTWKKELM